MFGQKKAARNAIINSGHSLGGFSTVRETQMSTNYQSGETISKRLSASPIASKRKKISDLEKFPQRENIGENESAPRTLQIFVVLRRSLLSPMGLKE